MSLSVGEVIELPVLAAGLPRVRVGGRALERPVRWVHISDLPDVASLLRGGELVLSTGTRLEEDHFDGEAYLRSLTAIGAVGLVVELGHTLPALPERLVRAARQLRFPLVELRRPVRFVSVTEVVHARLLNEQHAQLEFSEQVHRTFAALTTGASGAAPTPGQVLDQAHALLSRPVVLEDLGHRLIDYRAAGGLGASASDIVLEWATRSRGGVERDGWVATPVGPVGQRWGRLVVPEPTMDTVRVRLVLERAADVLTITRLISQDAADLVAEASSALLKDLLGADRRDEAGLRVRARSLGLALEEDRQGLLPLAIHHARASAPLQVQEIRRVLRRVGLSGLAGAVEPGVLAILVPVTAEQGAQRAAECVARAVATAGDWPDQHAVLATGAASMATTLAEAGEGLLEAIHVAAVAASIAGRDRTAVARSSDLGARSLLWHLRDDPRLDTYVEGQIGALLQEGSRNCADLSLLRAVVTAGGSMTRVAAMTGLNRSALYARVHRLGQRLGRDLDDPEVRTSLHLALLAHDLHLAPEAGLRARSAATF